MMKAGAEVVRNIAYSPCLFLSGIILQIMLTIVLMQALSIVLQLFGSVLNLN